MFLEKGGLKICNNFTGEQPCQSPISISCWYLQPHVTFELNQYNMEHNNILSLWKKTFECWAPHVNKKLTTLPKTTPEAFFFVKFKQMLAFSAERVSDRLKK